MDTLGELAQAMQENDNVMDVLEQAMGSKASQDLTSTVRGAINSINTSFVTAAASNPYGNYPISEDSYVLRNKYGQVDIFCNVTCAAAAQNTWHTVALVGADYQPDNYRALRCIAINTASLVQTPIQCFVYSIGAINIHIGNLPEGEYVYIISGSYFVN